MLQKCRKADFCENAAFWHICGEIVAILKGKTLSLEEIVQGTKEKNLREVINLLMNMEIEGIVEEKMGEGYTLV